MARSGVNRTFVSMAWAVFHHSRRTLSLIFTTSTKTGSPQTGRGTRGSGTSRSRPSLHDRNLVVAGLRSRSGRGDSAARMTARDAAHLLVAVLASSQLQDSVETVRQYSEAGVHNITSGDHDGSLIAALRNSPPDHSCVDAIEASLRRRPAAPRNRHARNRGLLTNNKRSEKL
jgi:hypothetical protein